MNWHKVRIALNQVIITDPTNVRAENLLRRIKKHLKQQTKARDRVYKAQELQANIARRLHNINLLDEALRNNLKIVALDAEWRQRKPITELGITVYHNGKFDAYNICVEPGGHRFLYGTTRYFTDSQAKKWLSGILQDTHLLIGHALKNDRSQLKIWGFDLPDIPVADTAYWSENIFPPNPKKLSFLASHYEVDCRGAHCAGNDSLMTLMVALRIRDSILGADDEAA